MDKKAFARRLQLLATDDQRRSKTARLRDVLDEVEIALAAGAKRVDILAELEAQGLRMSLSTFETTLKRLRARRNRGASAQFSAQSYGTCVVVPVTPSADHVALHGRTSHDPAELDRIIATPPDLTALARLAKRSKT